MIYGRDENGRFILVDAMGIYGDWTAGLHGGSEWGRGLLSVDVRNAGHELRPTH